MIWSLSLAGNVKDGKQALFAEENWWRKYPGHYSNETHE